MVNGIIILFLVILAGGALTFLLLLSSPKRSVGDNFEVITLGFGFLCMWCVFFSMAAAYAKDYDQKEDTCQVVCEMADTTKRVRRDNLCICDNSTIYFLKKNNLWSPDEDDLGK